MKKKKSILFLLISVTIQAQFFDLTDLLPKGHVKDGTVGYTDYTQTGINHCSKVLMPSFFVLIDDKVLRLKSNIF